MPNYIRWREGGATYSFTVVTYRRRPLLASDAARAALRLSFELAREQWPFEMLASVLLPDHLHCIWRMPPNDDDFSLRWSKIKERFTRALLAAGAEELRMTTAQRKERRRGIWQPRFWEHRVRDERDYEQHRDYIHFNPVKHGYVRTPEEWPWSTVHAQLRSGELAPDWWNRVDLVLPEVPE
jgi:putative transposase